MSSERIYCGQQFFEPSYDSLHLENVKVSTTAERKKPLLITKTLGNGRNQVEPNAISQDEVFVKSRYETRRKFFEDLERRKSLTTDSIALSRTETSTNNEENGSKENPAVDPNEKSRVHLVKPCDKSLTNANVKEHIENSNDEARSSDEVAVEWANIMQPSFVKHVNMEETKPSSRNTVSCINGDSQTEEETGHRERAECLTAVSVKTESLTTLSLTDKSDPAAVTSNEQHTLTSATNTEVTLGHSYAKTFPCDNKEDTRPPNDLSFNNCDERSIDHYECGKDKKADKEMNGELKSTAELKKQSVRSWIESSMCESSWPDNAEIDSYESYCNDITKIVESIDVNIASSRTELDALPDTDTCVKYNLDSTNMSLIYSLTPPAAVDPDESGNDDTSRDVTERSSDWSDNDEPLSDYIWIEPTTKTEGVKSARDCRSSSGSNSYAELEQPMSENHSASGSDILELPSRTIRELKDIDGEIFLNGINESANEIIADLNASDEAPSCDAVEVARQIINEIVESIYVLLHLDSSIYDLSVVREIVRNLIDSYRHECSLVESADRVCVSDVFTAIGNDVDSICRIKGFLGNLSSDFDDYDNRDYEMRIRGGETEGRESSAVIEFCTVAKKLPIVAVDNGALELNFRVVKVSSDEYARMSPDVQLRLFAESSMNDYGRARDDRCTAAIKPEMETWPSDRCSYCREEEESMREKLSCLTPISEEPDDAPCEADSVTSPLKNPEPLRDSEVRDIIEEYTASPTRKPSLDDTYTISEVSSVVISDNDTNELEERCDVWDSSVDCMSYSYETKEFMRLEKAIADSSRLSA